MKQTDRINQFSNTNNWIAKNKNTIPPVMEIQEGFRAFINIFPTNMAKHEQRIFPIELPINTTCEKEHNFT